MERNYTGSSVEKSHNRACGLHQPPILRFKLSHRPSTLPILYRVFALLFPSRFNTVVLARSSLLGHPILFYPISFPIHSNCLVPYILVLLRVIARSAIPSSSCTPHPLTTSSIYTQSTATSVLFVFVNLPSLFAKPQFIYSNRIVTFCL